MRHENVIEIITASPEFAKAAKAKRDKTVAERRLRLAEIERLDAEAARAWSRQEKLKNDAATAERIAREAFIDAQRRHRQANDLVTRERQAFDTARRDHELALIEGAADLAEQLREFRDYCEAEIERTTKAVQSREIVERDKFSGRVLRRRIGNGASVNARLDAIRAALRDIPEMMLTPDVTEIPAKIAAIKAAWPSVETLNEVA